MHNKNEMEGNFDFSKMTLGEFLKMLVSTVIEENNRKNAEMINEAIEELKRTMRAETARMQMQERMEVTEAHNEELLFGYFHRNDLVCMCDKRLYEGPHAPFPSKDGVQRFSSRHPTLFIKGGRGLKVAKAGDIYDLCYNQEDRDLLNGKGINTKHRRK